MAPITRRSSASPSTPAVRYVATAAKQMMTVPFLPLAATEWAYANHQVATTTMATVMVMVMVTAVVMAAAAAAVMAAAAAAVMAAAAAETNEG